LRWLNSQVGTPLFGYPFIIQRGGRQRLILTQPTEDCLRFFADRDDVTVNYVEIALDIITPFAWQLKRAVIVGFLHRWHGKRKWTIFDNGNFRTADLGHPGLFFQPYDTKPSKVTDEGCFHVEAKINGVRALRQLGIHTISDLFTFDYAKFWQRHFHIVEIDMAKLGRFHANLGGETKRRAPLVHRSRNGFVYNVDAAAGNFLFRVFGAVPDDAYYDKEPRPDRLDRTVQQFLKAYTQHCHSFLYNTCRIPFTHTKYLESLASLSSRFTHSVTADILHQFGVLPEPDLSLLKPDFCYPLRCTRRPLLRDRPPVIPSRIRQLKPPAEPTGPRYHYGRQSRDD
jgi:hypothetical protein